MPNIFMVECTHNLVRPGRAAKWGIGKTAQCAAYIKRSGRTVQPMEVMARRAHEYHLWGYDSLYFDIARTDDIAVATLAAESLCARRRFGIEVWQLGK